MLLTSAFVSNIGFRAYTSGSFIASCVAGAVVVGLAGEYVGAARARVGVGRGALGTLAGEGAGAVDAVRARAARALRRALVHVQALAARVARVALGAGARVTARRVGARGVRAAAARARARVALVHVHAAGRDVRRVEGPALLAHAVRVRAVRLAVGVLAAAHVVARRAARLARRRAHEPVRARAREPSRRVHAHRVVSTRLSFGLTFVDIHTY